MMLALSSKCYLAEALWRWCVDRGLTPYLSARVEGSHLPAGYGQDGTIVLNLAPEAVRDLRFGADGIGCRTRFGGVVHDVWIPAENVLAIFSRETGHGLALANEMFTASEPGEDDLKGESAARLSSSGGGFKRVK